MTAPLLTQIRRYPRHGRLWAWSVALTSFLLLTLLCGPVLRYFKQEHLALVEEKITKRQQILFYKTYATYLADPTSLYNQLNQQGLFAPTPRPKLLKTLQEKAALFSLSVKNFMAGPTTSASVFQETPFKVHLQASDDRQLYQLLRNLDEAPDFLWQPQALTILYAANGVSPPFFNIFLKGTTYKFRPIN